VFFNNVFNMRSLPREVSPTRTLPIFKRMIVATCHYVTCLGSEARSDRMARTRQKISCHMSTCDPAALRCQVRPNPQPSSPVCTTCRCVIHPRLLNGSGCSPPIARSACRVLRKKGLLCWMGRYGPHRFHQKGRQCLVGCAALMN
jgi:hypothetical protein